MESKGDVTIQIASDIDFDKLVAEIYYQGRFAGLISQDRSELEFVFPEAHQPASSMPLDRFIAALAEAKRELIGNN